jgi:hemerythrin-like domain-containing protein
MNPAPADSFVSLTEVHEQLFADFVAHQVALLRRDFDGARANLKLFRAKLERHIAAEEELFDSVFAHTSEVTRAAGQIGRAPIDLFTGEHKHFRELLIAFEQLAAKLKADDPEVDERLLDLLEEEATFKTFFRHHDERERNLLYPALDEHVAAGLRPELLRRFHEKAQD